MPRQCVLLHVIKTRKGQLKFLVPGVSSSFYEILGNVEIGNSRILRIQLQELQDRKAGGTWKGLRSVNHRSSYNPIHQQHSCTSVDPIIPLLPVRFFLYVQYTHLQHTSNRYIQRPNILPMFNLS